MGLVTRLSCGHRGNPGPRAPAVSAPRPWRGLIRHVRSCHHPGNKSECQVWSRPHLGPSAAGLCFPSVQRDEGDPLSALRVWLRAGTASGGSESGGAGQESSGAGVTGDPPLLCAHVPRGLWEIPGVCLGGALSRVGARWGARPTCGAGTHPPRPAPDCGVEAACLHGHMPGSEAPVQGEKEKPLTESLSLVT